MDTIQLLQNYAKNNKKNEFIALYITYHNSDKSNATMAFDALRKNPSLTSSSSSFSSSTFTGNNLGNEGIVSTIGGFVNNKIKSVFGITNEMLDTQLSKSNQSNLKIPTELLESISRYGISLNTIGSILGSVFNKITDQLTLETELLEKINQKTSLTGELSESLRIDLENSSIYAEKFGISLNEISDFYVSIVENSGKLTMINRGIVEQSLPLSKAFDISMGSLGNTITMFNDVGISMKDTIKSLGEAGIKSTSLGLSGKKIIEGIQSNIGLLNSYGFKNGIDGLIKMTQKMNEFKVSFESVKTLADKVFEPEGALDLVANIQALGGAVGDLNDPLKLMYMATNDVGGLQDAIIGASKSLANYNQEQGRFEITGVNLRLAKARADALGISYEEFAKTAIKASERTTAANQLMSKGFGLDEKEMEFLTNLSTMEDGKMVIKLPEDISKKIGAPIDIALDDMDLNTKNLLLSNQKLIEKMSTEDIAQKQLTQLNQIANNTNSLGRYSVIRAARGTKGVVQGLIGNKSDELNKDLNNQVTIRRGKIGTVEDQKEMKEKTQKFKEHPLDTTFDVVKTMYNKIKNEGVESLTKNEYTDAFYTALVRYNYDFNKTKQETFNGNINSSDYHNNRK